MTLIRLYNFYKWHPIILKSMRNDRGLIALHYALKNNKDVKTILFILSADDSLPWVSYLQEDLGAILDYYNNYQDKLYKRRCRTTRRDVLMNELFINAFV